MALEGLEPKKKDFIFTRFNNNSNSYNNNKTLRKYNFVYFLVPI
jgi:hypothetical protein